MKHIVYFGFISFILLSVSCSDDDEKTPINNNNNNTNTNSGGNNNTNNEKPCTAPEQPEITANKTELVEGEELIIQLKGQPKEGLEYAWKGPNGFSSNSHHTSIGKITPNQSGEYRLIAIDDTCRSEPAILNIQVDSLKPKCDPPQHVLNINGNKENFGKATVTNQSQYRVEVNKKVSPTKWKTLEISFDAKPEPGYYEIGFVNQQETAKLNYWPGTALNLDHSPSFEGEAPLVFVTKQDNQLTYTFCEVIFTNSQSSESYEIDGKITEN